MGTNSSTRASNRGLGRYLALFRRDRSRSVDNDLAIFIELNASNTVRWDLLVFFGKHPSAKKTAQAVAEKIGYHPSDVESELNNFVSLGIFSSRRNGKGMIYELANHDPIRRAVSRFSRRAALD